jgi:Icc-related predicted phosphoesterase
MRKIKVAAVADMHGHLDFDVPRCDLFLIAGDLCPWRSSMTVFDQAYWLRKEFAPWLAGQPVGRTVVTWGNHDWVAEKAMKSSDVIPKVDKCHFLIDQMNILAYGHLPDEDEEYRIWGTPWQPPFCDWAFNLPEDELKKKWARIPDRTDILVCHGPPRGYGDLIPNFGDKLRRPVDKHELWTPEGMRVGSPSLLERILEVKPKLAVYGHIHVGFGRWEIDHGGGRKTTLANVAMVNERYERIRGPQTFEVSWK